MPEEKDREIEGAEGIKEKRKANRKVSFTQLLSQIPPAPRSTLSGYTAGLMSRSARMKAKA